MQNIHTTKSIAKTVEGELIGADDISITGVQQLDNAKEGELTFIGSNKYAAKWNQSKASAALVTRSIDIEKNDNKAIIFVDDADLAMAKALELFAPDSIALETGIHKMATVHPKASVSNSAKIGAGCVIGAGVIIEDDTILYPNVTVLNDSSIGAGSVLWSGAVVRERCTIGKRCILHPNVTVGGDGFGYRPAQGENGTYLKKIPQIGTVEIADDVEIGAGTAIDRGKFSATKIGAGTKIDNLVQIGHNCDIGKSVIIAGCTGIAGSVTIKDGAMIGGMVGIKDHITIGAGATLTANAQILEDMPDGQTWGGTPARPVKQAIREAIALKKLPALIKQLKKIKNNQ